MSLQICQSGRAAVSRILRVAAAQSGPIQKADSRQSVVRRMIDLLDQAKSQNCDLWCSPSSR